tara:strand:- start:1670 stop:1819 length:150 start_codon:yes stop_codon:yes gene_type:complete
MDIDLLIPLFWTIAFGSLVIWGLRKINTKPSNKKKWVRPSLNESTKKKE